MNPYRINSNTKPIDEIISDYSEYQKNPASEKTNIMEGRKYFYLNPGLQNVRDFIVDTVLEFLNKYKEVDAIHFDDYFYNNDIYSGDDQNIFKEFLKNNPNEDKSNWRREQVNILIESLHNNITNFNKKNKKYIQFGISPSGIYKNSKNGQVTYDDKGNAITEGSATEGLQHYEDHLFCDTLKWINNGWIDYIIPQIYWAHDHENAHFKKVIDWWNRVVLYKKVNLYAGIGLYKCYEESETFGWKKDYNELYNQLTFTPDNIKQKIEGFSIFQFTALTHESEICSEQIKNGMKAWETLVPPSEIKSFERIIPTAPKNIELINNSISFDKIEEAKFYIVYRSEDEEINFNSREIVDIFGSKEENVIWYDTEEGNFTYGVKALSFSNTLGEGKTTLKDLGEYIKSVIIYYLAMLMLIL